MESLKELPLMETMHLEITPLPDIELKYLGFIKLHRFFPKYQLERCNIVELSGKKAILHYDENLTDNVCEMLTIVGKSTWHIYAGISKTNRRDGTGLITYLKAERTCR